MSSAANGIQRGDQRSASERARVTLRVDIPAGTGRLPDRIRACLFDLDGGLTETATLHAAAWKQTFDEYDGGTIERDHLHGKPAPDSFLAAARELGVELAAAAMFEHALAGQAVALRRLGADVVVADLAELLASS